MILDRLDPDRLYPARLAGRHAWAAWGLTRRQDDDTVELLVPARDAPRLVPDITARAAVQLATPVWPSPTLPTVTTNADTVDVADGDHRARLQVVTRTWYLPAAADIPDPGEVVSADGWPLIDEHSAIRDRFESLSTPVGREDVLDVANWVATKAAQARHGRDAPTHLSSVLDRLRRTTPDAYQAISRVVTHAHQIHAQLPDPARTAAAMRLLSAAINAPSNGIRRERSANHTRSSTTRVRTPSPSRGRAR